MKKSLLASLSLVLTACSQTTPQEKIVKALESIQSWTATAQMVGETWQQGDISTTYAQQTLEKSQQEIAKETKGINVPSAIAIQIDHLQQTLQQMNTDLKQEHRSEIAVEIQQLAKESQQIDAFIKTQEKQL